MRRAAPPPLSPNISKMNAMTLSPTNLTLLLVSLMILTLVLASACEDREPQDLSFSMSIEGGELAAEESTLTVNQHDTVTIDWMSDLPLLVHLHGYNIEAQMEPGETAQMSFVADATGRYDIFIHAAEGVLTAGSGMDGMSGMDSSSDSESVDHSEHSMTEMAVGPGVRERKIATLEVRP